MTISGEKITK